jgi:hypothetical protein
MKQYVIEHKRPTAIIYRIEGEDETMPCPFCKNTHVHGGNDGHRIAHCAPVFTRGGKLKFEPKETITADDGTQLYKKHGYVVVEIGRSKHK